jgi:transposase
VNRIICGVDVSKDWLDVYLWPDGAVCRFTNDTAGGEALSLFCRDHDVELVVMEASGGYERLVFLLLWANGIACGLVNPRSVRRFAEGLDIIEKTDRLDAAVIARYGALKQIAPTPPPSPAQQRLRALVSRLSQLTADITLNKQRRSAATDGETLASLDTVIACLKREERRLAGEVASLIDDDPLWRKLDGAFRSFKGVAGRTVARLLGELPEIGIVSNKAIAKLAGLAPIANDSGKRTGKRHIRAGRQGPRSILFIVARMVASYDPHLKAFAERLHHAGKPKMVVRIALARKLLVILNAKARDARNEFVNAT